MNKKISTLVAALLAAGYSYTVEAGIVKVTSIVDGQTYVIAAGDFTGTGNVLANDYAMASYSGVGQTWKGASNKLKTEAGSPFMGDGSDGSIGSAKTTEVVFAFTGGALTTLSLNSYTALDLNGTPAFNNTAATTSAYLFAITEKLAKSTEAAPLAIGGKYLVVKEGAVTLVPAVDYVLGTEKTVWSIDADGKASTKIGEETKYLVLSADAPALGVAAGASVLEVTVDNTLSVGNQYVSADGKLQNTVATTKVSTSNPAEFTTTVVSAIEKALVNFPAASRMVVYVSNTPQFVATKDDSSLDLNANYTSASNKAPFYWTMDGGKITNAAGKPFSGGSYSEFILLKEKDGKAFFQLMTKDGKYVGLASGNGAFEIKTTAGDAATFSAVETETTAVTVEDLNKQVGNGFDLSIYTKKDGTTDVEGADVFTGVLTAEGVTPADNDKVYYLKNADGKYLALNNDKAVDGAVWGSSNNMNGNNGAGFKFTEVDKKDAEKVYTKFKIETADNGASQLVVRVMKDNTNEFGRLFITKFNDKYYLTTKLTLDAGEAWPYIVYGSNNRVDIKTLLKGQFVNIAFANKQAKVNAEGKVLANEKYKLGGVLAIAREKGTADPEAEYVPANNVLTTSPETQWAIQYVAEGNNSKATFVNRENPAIKVSGVVLYKTDVADVYAVTAVDAKQNVVAKDTIRLSFVNHSMFDGFKYVDAAGLNDTIYNIAAYKAVNDVNNAYWVEKNHSTTHQIGLDGDVENAGKWNLRLATKNQDEKEVIDTVFVISEMSILKDGKVADKMKKDTLAILPYVLQNAGNREFVKYDGTKGVEYYVCDKDNKTRKNNAAKFALKVQPNGTYHIVTIGDLETATAITGKPAYTLGDKVFAGNAAKGGTLDNIANYTTTFNDLMVVEPVDAPEYRKVVKEWGDTIRIYRDDNSAQVLYEKLDPKSVVKGESFLNIDNVNQFDVNPALFVDTAYINRGNNTCWQYLLAVNVDKENSYYCPYNAEHNTDAWREANGGPCADAKEHRALKGRFLINLMDTANVYEATNQHGNPYVNEIEADETLAKLAFVPGYHIADTLFITRANGDTVRLEMDAPDFNIAKFAFRYVDRDAKSFKIQTQVKSWKYGDLTNEDYDAPTANQGYLKWINGTVVVVPSFEKGDVFNMNEDETRTPTENEGIDASKVAVIAGAGSVTIQNAAGKTVTISNILGKTIANTVISSDNATISVPAGITVVSVEGEDTVKAIVK